MQMKKNPRFSWCNRILASKDEKICPKDTSPSIIKASFHWFVELERARASEIWARKLGFQKPEPDPVLWPTARARPEPEDHDPVPALLVWNIGYVVTISKIITTNKPIYRHGLKKNGPFPASFSLFSSFLDSNWHINMFELLPMSGFEPRISDVESDRSANCATTTAPYIDIVTFTCIYHITRRITGKKTLTFWG